VAAALDPLLFVLLWALVAALALGARWWWRRPRLAVELSLRGSTRAGTLYVRAHNRGRRSARGVVAHVAWEGDAGQAAVASQDLGEIEGLGAAQWPVRDLHTAIAERPEGWHALRVVARAQNAREAEARLDLRARKAEEAVPATPVRYQRAPCPGSADGAHLFRVARFPNDGVVETWRVCQRCGALEREPLSAQDEATQARVRRERAARERRALEEELAREERKEAPRPRRAPRDDDTMPVDMAYFVLGLEEDATWEDVLAAHRRLALANHPDRGAPEERAAREGRMADVNRARDRLRDRLLP
jgi:hypothetical protein